jgi:hypothetical protein
MEPSEQRMLISSRGMGGRVVEGTGLEMCKPQFSSVPSCHSIWEFLAVSLVLHPTRSPLIACCPVPTPVPTFQTQRLVGLAISRRPSSRPPRPRRMSRRCLPLPVNALCVAPSVGRGPFDGLLTEHYQPSSLTNFRQMRLPPCSSRRVGLRGEGIEL